MLLTQEQTELDNAQLSLINRNNVVFPIIITIIWCLYPLISVFLFLYILSVPNKLHLFKFNILFLIVLISCSFGLLSYVCGSGGNLETDMIRYRQVFGLMPYRDISDLLINGSSFFFVLLNWIIANKISADDQIMSLIFMSISYFFLLLSIYKLSIQVVARQYYFLIFLSIVFIVSIITTTEYIKQVLSSTIFLYALVSKIQGSKYSGIYLLISIILHISSLMFIPIYFFNIKFIRNNIIYIVIFSVVFSQIDVLNLLSFLSDSPLMIALKLDEKLNTYSDSVYEGFGGSKRYYLIFIFYIIQITPIILHFYKNKNIKHPICVLFLLTLCLLLLNMNNTHNFARLTRNLYLFQILALIYSVQFIPIRFRKLWIYFVLGCLFGSNFIEFIRTMTNPAYHATFMGNDYLALLFSTVIDFLKYKMINPL